MTWQDRYLEAEKKNDKMHKDIKTLLKIFKDSEYPKEKRRNLQRLKAKYL